MGSKVQLFTDDAGEGQIYLGETTTRADGSWSVTGLPFAALAGVTATVTNADTGDTSEFGTLSFVQVFTVTRRLEDAPVDRTAPFEPASPFSAFPLKLDAGGADVVIESLLFELEGTLDLAANTPGLPSLGRSR